MSTRFLVLQHIDVEHPGIFRDFMQAEGITWDGIELDVGDALPAVDDYAGLMVMGGPMDVWEESQHPWLTREKDFIRHWVGTLQRPFLGVCLGHQLLADAMGGTVAAAAAGEVGVLPVTLTTEGRSHDFYHQVPATFDSLQWHGAEVTAAPAGAAILATSPACNIQSLAIGTHAFSFQFHVEVTALTVDEWYQIPAYRDGLHQALGHGGVDRFRTTAAARLPDFNRLAEQLYRNWRRSAFAAST